MADQLFTASKEIVPFVGLPEVERIRSGLPWGKVIHRGNEAIASSAVAGEKIQLNLPLPTNFVARLKHVMVHIDINSATNQWIADPQLRVYYAPVEQQQVFPTGYTTLLYPFVAGADVAWTNDSVHVQHYTPGQWVTDQDGAQVAGGVCNPLSSPTILLTTIPAGVGTQEPAFRVWNKAATDAGSLNYIWEWDLFTIEQRNHVMVNFEQPVLA